MVRHCSRGGPARPDAGVLPLSPYVPWKIHSRAVPSLEPLASRSPECDHATLVTSLRWPRSVATHTGAPPAGPVGGGAPLDAPAPPDAPASLGAPAPPSAASAPSCGAPLRLAALRSMSAGGGTRKTCKTASVVPTAKRRPPVDQAAWKTEKSFASFVGSCVLSTAHDGDATAGEPAGCEIPESRKRSPRAAGAAAAGCSRGAGGESQSEQRPEEEMESSCGGARGASLGRHAHVTAGVTPVSVSSTATHGTCGWSMAQMRTARSLEAEARSRPAGCTLRSVISPRWPRSVRSSRHERQPHTLTSPSSAPVKTRSPTASKTTQ